jgi:hypothetical protein
MVTVVRIGQLLINIDDIMHRILHPGKLEMSSALRQAMRLALDKDQVKLRMSSYFTGP